MPSPSQDTVACTCPSCGNLFAVKASFLGRQVKCPICTASVTARQEEKPLEPEVVSSPTPTDDLKLEPESAVSVADLEKLLRDHGVTMPQVVNFCRGRQIYYVQGARREDAGVAGGEFQSGGCLGGGLREVSMQDSKDL